MGRITRRRRVLKVRAGEDPIRTEGRLAVEEPLEIRSGGRPLATMLRTPGHDVELAAGFLLGQGVLTEPDDLRSAIHCNASTPIGLTPADSKPGSGENVLSLRLGERATAAAAAATAAREHVSGASSCGLSGEDFVSEMAARLEPIPDGPSSIPARVLVIAPELLNRQQRLRAQTGGTHAAGLISPAGELIVAREDVNQANAVDKVLGWALLNRRLPLTGELLRVTGRASFELVQRAALARIPLVAAISTPSSLAVELADALGMTLIGCSRDGSLNIYTHPERIDSRPG